MDDATGARGSYSRGQFLRAGAAGAGLFLFGAGCSLTPGGGSKEQAGGQAGPVSKDISGKGPLTLLVWDFLDAGQAEIIEGFNKDFEERYPDITVERNAKSFDDMKSTLKLALSSEDPPDAATANQGWPDMGSMVKGGLLLPLDKYAEAYGWTDRLSGSLLQQTRFSEDGTQFGTGNLYGAPYCVTDILGVYYNKAKLEALGREQPSSLEDFEGALQAAKEAGEIPLQFGNLDKYPGLHEFMGVQNALASRDYIRDFVYGRGGVSFETRENAEVASTLQRWAEQEYFTPGFNGAAYDDVWPRFADGEGVFLLTGTWLNPDLEDGLGEDLGFFVLRPDGGGTAVATGSPTVTFSISSKSKNPDVAAAYIDSISNKRAAQIAAEAGSITLLLSDPPVSQGSARADVFSALDDLQKNDAFVPYLDWAAPTMYDSLSGGIQELLAGKTSPEQLLSRVQADYAEFQAG